MIFASLKARYFAFPISSSSRSEISMNFPSRIYNQLYFADYAVRARRYDGTARVRKSKEMTYDYEASLLSIRASFSTANSHESLSRRRCFTYQNTQLRA